MGRRLEYTVFVRHDGETHCITPDEDVPEWAVDLIDPGRFVKDEPDPELVAAAEAPIPPRSGRGSGLAAWAKYADSKGVEVEDDDTRDDIIDKLDAAGIPVDDE